MRKCQAHTVLLRNVAIVRHLRPVGVPRSLHPQGCPPPFYICASQGRLVLIYYCRKGKDTSMDGLTQRSKEQPSTEGNYSKETKKKARTSNKGFKTLGVAVLIPLGLGIVDSVLFNPNGENYKQLKKPWWNPPGWVFGLAWSVFYSLMGVASWLVWVEGGFQKQARPLAIYALQLVVNLLWPAIFTGLRKTGLALVDLGLLDVLVYVCIVFFKPVNHVAANLLKPYLAWVLFATALNYKIYTLNLDP